MKQTHLWNKDHNPLSSHQHHHQCGEGWVRSLDLHKLINTGQLFVKLAVAL